MMCAYRAWIPAASSAFACLAAAAGPLSADDIRQERQSVAPEICLEKASAFSCLQATGSDLAKWVLVSGASPVQNKLAAVDTSVVIPPRETLFEPLPSHQAGVFGPGIARQHFMAHAPENGHKNLLDPHGIPHPERYLAAGDLGNGVNVLVPAAPIQAPACLCAADLESYIHFRLDLGLKTGDYWTHLHSTKLTDEQLALLRYYDYLDANAPKQPVAVYRCTELVILGKH